MGFKSVRGFSSYYYWCVVLYALSFSANALALANIGVAVRAETEQYSNRFIKQYRSCALGIAEAGDVFARLGFPVPPDSLRAHRERVGAIFKTDREHKLTLEVVPGLRIEDNPVAYLPSQTFLLSSVESQHKMISNLVVFEGVFVLLARDRAKLGNAWTDYLDHNLSHVEVANAENISSGMFYLIPVEQFVTINEVKRVGIARAFQNPIPSPSYVYKPVVSPGLEKTSGGTQYVFFEDGSVRIFGRNSEPISFSPPPQWAYSSHAEILRRQGVYVDSESPPDAVEDMRKGLRANRPLIENYARAAGETDALALHYYRVAKLSETFDTDRVSAQSYALSQIINVADAFSPSLPAALRWNSVSAFRRAPDRTEGEYVESIARSFIVIHSPSGADTYPGDRIRILTDAIHLQAVQAHLGDFALKLEGQGLVSGGGFKFYYDPDSHALTKVELVSSGMYSLARPGTITKLSVMQLAELETKVRRELSSVPNVEIDFSKPD